MRLPPPLPRLEPVLEPAFAIEGATLLDGIHPEPVFPASVVVGADGRIEAAGASDTVSVPPGVPVTDAAGMTVMPGLIDAHVHLAWDKTLYLDRSWDDYEARLRNRDPQRDLLLAARYAQLALAAGVTTVRDCGADDFAILTLRDSVNAGEFAGPRILGCGRPITTTRGHTYSGWGVDTTAALREAVHTLAARGVDFIKVMVSGGTTTPGSDITRNQYTLEQVCAAVSEAHGLGLQVAAHAISTDSIRLAAEAGVDTIEHCSWIGNNAGETITDEAAVDWMLANDVRVDHAIVPRPYLFPGECSAAPNAEEEWWLRMLQVRWPYLHHMRERGVTVCAATDAAFGPWPGHPGWRGAEDMARALEILVRHGGFTPAAAIALGTSEAARALGLDAEIGAVRPGLRADLLMLARNPLDDIRALREAEMVFLEGRLAAHRGRLVVSH
jgi:imidazolonepropionase-like amidohydrolase